MEMLKTISTKELVDELRTREGVETKIAEPYTKSNFSVEGSAVVLIVID